MRNPEPFALCIPGHRIWWVLVLWAFFGLGFVRMLDLLTVCVIIPSGQQKQADSANKRKQTGVTDHAKQNREFHLCLFGVAALGLLHRSQFFLIHRGKQ